MSDNPIKKYPPVTQETAKFFGLPFDAETAGGLPTVSETDADNHGIAGNAAAANGHGNKPGAEKNGKTIPANLPLAEAGAGGHFESGRGSQANNLPVGSPVPDSLSRNYPQIILNILKKAGPYAAVFVTGVFLYFFFFGSSSLDVFAFFRTKPHSSAPKQTALAQLEQSSLAEYQSWINGFYYDVTDAKITNPESDNSGNGLSNFQKFLLNLNPKSYDTLGLGRADSETLAAGLNPLTGNKLTDAQKNIIDKYFDMETIMNRLALSHLQQAGQVDSASSFNSYLSGQPTSQPSSSPVGSSGSVTPRQSMDGNGNSDSFGNPNSGAPSAFAEDLNKVDIDLSIPGRLEIPALNVNAPLMWSTDPKNFEKDLQSGVVHYPGTALPGQIGNTYISGHSSNYIWAKGDYNHVFTHLGDLANNESFKITVVQKNGKDAILHYVVTGRQEYDPKDQAQFQNGGKSVVSLSTCWPVGSTAKRLVVFGELTQVEK
ncbi:MAG: sortase [Patescibacteria group bacterium]|nr:sortase [Patescibacteria group bacterium]